MGCSFGKVKPKSPNKLTGESQFKITPEGMRESIPKKKGKIETTEQNRRPLINYNFQKEMDPGMGLSQKNIKVKNKLLGENAERLENRIKIKKAKEEEKEMKSEEEKVKKTKFLKSPNAAPKQFNNTTLNKNTLYFKTLPKEIKEMRFQSLKVKEMEEINKISLGDDLRASKRIKNKSKKLSVFSRFKSCQRIIDVKKSIDSEEKMPILETILQENEELKKKRTDLGTLVKSKIKFKIPRTKTTYKQNKTTNLTREDKEVINFQFNGLNIKTVIRGESKSDRGGLKEDSFSSEDETEKEEENKEEEMKKYKTTMNDLKVWSVSYFKVKMENSRLKMDLKILERQNEGIGNKILEEDLSDYSSLFDENNKDKKELKEGNEVSDDSSSLLLDNDQSNKSKNSLYDSVFGLKGLS